MQTKPEPGDSSDVTKHGGNTSPKQTISDHHISVSELPEEVTTGNRVSLPVQDESGEGPSDMPTIAFAMLGAGVVFVALIVCVVFLVVSKRKKKKKNRIWKPKRELKLIVLLLPLLLLLLLIIIIVVVVVVVVIVVELIEVTFVLLILHGNLFSFFYSSLLIIRYLTCSNVSVAVFV